MYTTTSTARTSRLGPRVYKVSCSPPLHVIHGQPWPCDASASVSRKRKKKTDSTMLLQEPHLNCEVLFLSFLSIFHFRPFLILSVVSIPWYALGAHMGAMLWIQVGCLPITHDQAATGIPRLVLPWLSSNVYTTSTCTTSLQLSHNGFISKFDLAA